MRGTQMVRAMLGEGAQVGREGVEHGLPGNLRKKGTWGRFRKQPNSATRTMVLPPQLPLKFTHFSPSPLSLPCPTSVIFACMTPAASSQVSPTRLLPLLTTLKFEGRAIFYRHK